MAPKIVKEKELAANRAELTSRMQQHRLVAVVRSKSAEEALATARAVADAGVWFVEITLTVPGALGVIKELAVRRDLFVGAGTVLGKKEAQQAIAAGARFVVSPTLELDLIPLCHKAGVACVSGAATPTEIVAAARGGADLVKIFPADCLGGVSFVRQMLGPLPNVRFMVSGGVDLGNVGEYVELGVTGLALSSAFLAELFAAGGRDRVREQARQFVEEVEKASQSR